MTKLTKKQKTLQEKYDSNKVYSIEEAMEIIQSVKSNKFDESIDISVKLGVCLLYTSPSPRDKRQSRMPSSA